MQYIQIAEIVLSKLPSTMQLPETRANHELTNEKAYRDDDERKGEDNVDDTNKAVETDGDMV